MAEMSKEPEWLIRDNTNVVRGPYSAREVLQLLKKGQLKGKTELCKANSYWFYVDERVELERFFPDATLTDTRRIQAGTLTGAVTKTLMDGSRDLVTSATPVPAVDPSDLPPERAIGTSTTTAPAKQKPKTSPAARLGGLAHVEDEEITQEIYAPTGEGNKKKLWVALGGAVAVLAVLAFLLIGKNESVPSPAPIPAPAKREEEPAVPKGKDSLAALPLDKRVLNAFLANDLEQAERALAQLESKKKGSMEALLVRAMIKRRFRLDLDGAMASLDQARAATKNPKTAAFLDLLRGKYLMQKDPAAAVGVFASVSEESHLLMAKWNLSVALLTVQNLDNAARVIDEVEKLGDPAGAGFLRGWMADIRTPGDTAVETHLQKALAARAESVKTHLLLGLHKLRRGQLPAAEENFRAFIDFLPELDSDVVAGEPQRLSPDGVYSWVALQIREVHGLSSSETKKPSAVVMATLAMLAGIEGRSSDATQILDTAARAGGGGTVVSKVMAYLKWKEGRFQDAADVLSAVSESTRDPAMNFLLGRALFKSGKASEALKPLETSVSKLNSRADVMGHLAEALAASKRDGDAKQYAEKALELDPFEPSALGVLSRLGEHQFLYRDQYRAFLPFGEI